MMPLSDKGKGTIYKSPDGACFMGNFYFFPASAAGQVRVEVHQNFGSRIRKA